MSNNFFARPIIPPHLQPGDEIRVVAMSHSLTKVPQTTVDIATNRIASLGYRLTLSQHCRERDAFDTLPVSERIADFHDALADSNVKAVLIAAGGYSSNQLLTAIDYDLVRRNPKIICGYSDITVVVNAIFAQTGLVTYLGPLFSSFGMTEGFDYSQAYFCKAVAGNGPFAVLQAERWSDDEWDERQDDRSFIRNRGMVAVNPGQVSGHACGGNLCSFNLLQGTPYFPPLAGVVLFIEDDDLVKGDSFAKEFDRNLQSLLHQDGFANVRGLVFGRFQRTTAMTDEKMTAIVKSKPELRDKPVIINADFGHTTPQCTIPIGGGVTIESGDQCIIRFME